MIDPLTIRSTRCVYQVGSSTPLMWLKGFRRRRRTARLHKLLSKLAFFTTCGPQVPAKAFLVGNMRTFMAVTAASAAILVCLAPSGAFLQVGLRFFHDTWEGPDPDSPTCTEARFCPSHGLGGDATDVQVRGLEGSADTAGGVLLSALRRLSAGFSGFASGLRRRSGRR
eukprot:scaffold1376_cov257-Pinguiococcus_pyrenoidosus.AAC.9